MTYVSILHVYREANMAADWLSKKGQTMFTAMVFWDNVAHRELSDIMATNRIRWALL